MLINRSTSTISHSSFRTAAPDEQSHSRNNSGSYSIIKVRYSGGVGWGIRMVELIVIVKLVGVAG